MPYRLLADGVVVLHLAFVLFALLGALLLPRYPKLAWLHLAALAWGLTVQWADLICPLTWLEIHLRTLGGTAGYQGRFIEHYLLPILYPGELTLPLRYLLGAILLAVNLPIYGWLLARRRQRTAQAATPPR